MLNTFFTLQTYKKDVTDYINDKLSGDLGTALKAIGKVKTIFEPTTSQESCNYVHCICLVETY